MVSNGIAKIIVAAFVSLLMLGLGIWMVIAPGNGTISPCYKLSATPAQFGKKCYISNGECPNDPCYCVGADFSRTCLPAPPGPGDNPVLIAGIVMTSLGGVAVAAVVAALVVKAVDARAAA